MRSMCAEKFYCGSRMFLSKILVKALMVILCLCEAPADKVSSRAFSIICKTEFCSKWVGVCVLYWKGQWRFLGIGLAKVRYLVARWDLLQFVGLVWVYAWFVIFGKVIRNCDEVKWSGWRSPEVAIGCGRSWRLQGLSKAFSPAHW